jgi:hypothetical protein
MNEFKEFLENVGKAAVSVNRWLSTIDWSEIYRKVDFVINQFPKEYEKLVLSLMDRGWFIWFGKNDNLNDFNNMFLCLADKDAPDQDQYLIQFTKNIQNSLLDFLFSNHPQRMQQIKDSFDAHNNKFYYASIPSFIALSEGICRDYFPQIGLFAKRLNKNLNKSEPITIDLFDGITFLDIFDEVFLKPLKVNSKITKTIKTPTVIEEQSFNRHLIMHGRSTKYGTEINSYKAISLLYYVSNAMKFLEDTKHKSPAPRRETAKAYNAANTRSRAMPA